MGTLRQKNAVTKLFGEIAPRSTNRNGGYTRIVRLGQRKSDSASMAFIEWVDAAPAGEEKTADEKVAKPKKEKVIKAKEPPAEPKESAPTPVEEPKPKRRGWLGRKSPEAGK